MWWLRILVLLLMTGAIPTSPSLLAPSPESANVEEPSNDVTAFPADWMPLAKSTGREEPTTIPSLLNSSINSTSPDVLTTSPPLLTSPLDSSKQNDSSIDSVVLLDTSATPSNWTETEEPTTVPSLLNSSINSTSPDVLTTSPPLLASSLNSSNHNDSSIDSDVLPDASATPSNWTETEDFSTLNGDDEPSTAPSESTTDNEYLTSTESLPIDDESKDANEKEVDSSSDRGDSPLAAPSQSESGDESKSTLNLTALDALSASDLKSKLNLAKISLEVAKNKTTDAERELNKKRQEAVEPNRDYEEKKKEWERLETIAQGKEKAEREFNAAKHALKLIMPGFTTAESALATKKDEILAVENEKLVIPTWPGLLQDAQDTKKRKDSAISILEPTIDPLRGDVITDKKGWMDAWSIANVTQELHDTAECDKPANAISELCKGYVQLLVTENSEVVKAKSKYDKTAGQLAADELKLKGLKNESSLLETEIKKLKENISKKTIAKADGEIEKLKGELVPIQATFDDVNTKKKAAEEDVKNKKIAKDAAEQSGGGIRAAKIEAKKAKALFTLANTTKAAIDEKILTCETALEKAKAAEFKEETNVGLLNEKFEMAAKREERKDEGSNTVGIVVGTVIGVFTFVGIIIGVILYIQNKKKQYKEVPTEDPNAPKKPEKDISSTGTPQKPVQSDSNLPNETGATTPQRVPPAQKTNNKDNEEGGEGLPDLATVPFIPGEEPFKIPAKNFKWRGPMRRRTRWHGPPDHDFEGKNNGVETVDKIWFDPNANYATEIGPNEIIEDGGPPSDSNRSEWLNNVDEWEKGRKALLAAEAAAKAAQGENGGKPAPGIIGKQLPSARNDLTTVTERQNTGTNIEEDARVAALRAMKEKRKEEEAAGKQQTKVQPKNQPEEKRNKNSKKTTSRTSSSNTKKTQKMRDEEKPLIKGGSGKSKINGRRAPSRRK